MNELKDKVIIVTGGASGIGEAVVRHIASAGAKVAVVDLDVTAASALAAQFEGSIAIRADVSNIDDVNAMCATVQEHYGRLDGAVNNAGIGGEFGPLVDCSPENWQRVLGVNLSSVFYCMKAQIPLMLASGGGSIVNTASMAGILGEPYLPAYIASKHGVVGLSKSVAIDYGPQGIRCNALCPSFIRTPMTESGFPDPAFWERVEQMHPIRRTVTVEEVANVAAFLLSDLSGGMTGSVHLADGGIAAQ